MSAEIDARSDAKSSQKSDLPDSQIIHSFRKQLADQSKTLFSAGLILLWASTINVVTVERSSWISWAIGSMILFVILMFWPRKIRWPKYRWLMALIAVLVLWIFYYVSGISLNNGILVILGGAILVWTLFLFGLLLVSLTNNRLAIKIEAKFRNFLNRLDLTYWEISIMVVLVSVILSWNRLHTSGMNGWWMFPLLVFGILIAFVVALIPVFSEKK
jgi:hypothetical protein